MQSSLKTYIKPLPSLSKVPAPKTLNPGPQLNLYGEICSKKGKGQTLCNMTGRSSESCRKLNFCKNLTIKLLDSLPSILFYLGSPIVYDSTVVSFLLFQHACKFSSFLYCLSRPQRGEPAYVRGWLVVGRQHPADPNRSISSPSDQRKTFRSLISRGRLQSFTTTIAAARFEIKGWGQKPGWTCSFATVLGCLLE